MAVSEVDLANLALGMLTRDSIRSLDGKEPGAVQTKQFMQQAIEEVIEEYDWPQCRVIKTLTAVELDDLRGWTGAYALPSDLVFLWRIEDSAGTLVTEFEVGMSGDVSSTTNYIYSSGAGLTIRYGSNRCPLSRFSPQTINLMAIKLAQKCCLPITKDKALYKFLTDQYKIELSKTMTRMANMEPELQDVEFIPQTISVRSE